MVELIWKTVLKFLKKLKIELPYDPATPLLGIYPKKMKSVFQKGTYIPPVTAASCTVAGIQKQLVSRFINRESVLYTHGGILFSRK